MSAGIYSITHIESGRIYVGSAKNVDLRFRQHKAALNARRHFNRHLQSAWVAHGANAFSFSIIEIVHNLTQLIEREQHWMDRLKAAAHPNYNLRPLANSTLGVTQTPESNLKRSRTQSGQPKPAGFGAKVARALLGRKKSADHVANGVAARAAGAGFAHTAETRAKMSASHKTSLRTAAHLQRLASAPRSAETRAKLAALCLLRLNTPETRAKKNAALRTPECRAKLSARSKARGISPELQTKMQAALGRKPKA